LLHAQAELARLFLVKEAEERVLSDHSTRREQLRQDRGGLQEKVQAAHTAWRTEQESLLNRELAVNDLRHRQDTLVGRLRDDYQVELAALYEEQQAKSASESASLRDPIDIDAANKEIEELRGKLQRLGSVNL